MSPALPAPGRQVTVSFALTQAGPNFVRVWCTLAPTGSSLDGKLNGSTDSLNRVAVFEGSAGSVWNYTFDKGGKYTFVAQEYLKGSGYGGGYEGDPNNSSNEEQLGPEATLTLHIGQRVTQPIGPPSNQATLVLWVWDNTIQATTRAFYGEDSPAITSLSPTPAVKTAIESQTVIDALAALVGQNIDTDVYGNLSVLVVDLFNSWNSHMGNSTVHANADADNVLTNSLSTSYTTKTLPDFVNAALVRFKRHMTNDTGVADPGTGASGPDTGDYHEAGSDKVSDQLNLPVYDSVSGFADAYGGLADLYRSLVAHGANEDVHQATGTTFPFGGDNPLLIALHRAFLSVIASITPDVPVTQSTGVQLLLTRAGFKEG